MTAHTSPAASSSSTAEARLRMARGGSGPGRPLRIEKAQDSQRALLRLLPYLRPYIPAILGVVALILVYTLLGLLGPYLMGKAIDDFIATGDAYGLARIAIAMLIVYISGSGAEAVSNWIMARVSQQALQNLRRDLFGHLQDLSLSFFDSHPAGELMSRLTNDIDAINQAVSQNVTALLASLLSLGGILIAMFVLNMWLALASVLVVPIMLWFTEFVARYTRKGFRDLQKQLGELNSVMEESISGQRVVKAFRRSESAVEAFRRHNQEVYRAGVYANSYALLLMPLTNVLGNFFVIVLAGLGGYLALQGLVTVGVIATFISYGRNFVQPLRQLANMYNAIQAALAGAERVFEIIDSPPERDEAAGLAGAAAPLEALHGQVCFEGVDFSYVPGTPVIRQMSLEARAGETVALVGPTGAGKTTLINLLSRFYEIDSGRITIDGHDIRSLPKAALRRQLGVVLQDTFLFSATVMENIRYGRLEASDEACVQAAELADANHFIRQLPHGYQTMLSERAGNLSQGQRQLLAIARAILADPGILILDEATSSVDTRTETRIQSALLRLMQGRTSFVIAHRLSTIRDAGQIVVIHDGHIVERGDHAALLARRGFYYKLYMAQFKGEAI
jgi:ATP-binding cassette, subfamily B, multidrug efflux pump